MEDLFAAGSSDLWDGAPGETRTPNPLLRRQMLYPFELRARQKAFYGKLSWG